MIFLIEYDRLQGVLLRIDQYEGTEVEKASQDRLRLELALNQGNIPREVVLLEAASIDALKRTHSRYFKNVGELARFDERELPHQTKKRDSGTSD